MRFTILLCFILLSVASEALAQSHLFRHITPRDGLPAGFIWTMTQDSKGFIWIGTNEGLAKHDGYSTIPYRNDPQDSTTIRSGIVSDIIEFDTNTFFLATTSGLELLNPATEVFSRLSTPDSMPPMSTVGDLLLLNEESLWIASNSGLYHMDPSRVKSGNPEFEFFEPPGLGSDQISGFKLVVADSQNNLWIASDTTLFKFDLDERSFIDVNPISDDAAQVIRGTMWSMIYTSVGDLIITSTTGLATLKNGESEIKEVKQLGEFGSDELRQASFQSVTEDSEGKLWLGTGLAGVLHWDPETGEAKIYRTSGDDNNTIASNDVHYAFEDPQGNMWFGYHYEGASIMYSESWNYEVSVPFPELPADDPRNTVTYAKMDDNGILWATTASGLIRDLGGEDQEYFSLPFTDIGPLVQIDLIHDNKIYLITQSVVGQSYQTAFIVFDDNNQNNPFSVLEVPNELNLTPGSSSQLGNMLYKAIFNSNRIVRLDLESGEIDTIELPVQGDYPEAVLTVSVPEFIHENELYAQHYFIGLPDGTKIEHFIVDLETGGIRTNEFEIDDPIIGLQPPLVSSYEPGVVYLNTIQGFFRLDYLNNNYTILFEDQTSLLREGSLLMTEDEEGYIWLNNLTGLTRLDPITENLEYFEVPREEYTPSRAVPSKLANGEIFFPGSTSYIKFDPTDLRGTQPVGETLITSLQAGDEEFDLVYNSMEPEIESDQNSLTFNFLGIDLRDPASIHYRYRILGSENEQWTRVGTQRSVFIPNLSAGDYTFEVQSGSQFGSFNDQTASLMFSVLPPWWNTIPAYLMYAFLLGGLIFAADRMQRRRVIQKERERSREKELAQAREIEKAYENLKAAQEQLVQQEKLASLGQLTAGIAHEIKNPLNFVNNFSELSVELVEEAREEIRDMRREMKGTQSEASAKDVETSNVKSETSLRQPAESAEAERRRGESGEGSSNENENVSTSAREPSLLLDILDDIEANLKTIHKHGSRADSIVKSMLQHSRGGSGKPEPTDLNALIREYANLSFHGMRAGDDPINVDVDLQLDENIGEVPLIAEDFSRVILNLTNNAFDAMAEKSRTSKVEGKKNSLRQPAESAEAERSRGVSSSHGYAPKLTVRTHQTEKTVTVEVEDNGPGIPQDIKDKILQPFFTTKKGTAGTGLGLSITNDIIKAHGGTLEIESVPGELTRFKIIISKDQL